MVKALGPERRAPRKARAGIARRSGWAFACALLAALGPHGPALAQPSAAGAGAGEPLAGCLQSLQPRALKAGVSADRYRALTAGLRSDPAVLALLDQQPEFRTPIWDYLAALVDEERVADGRAMLAQWRSSLDAVASRFGVDAETVVAVWGVESNYGRSFGKRPLLTSLATLSCMGRRQDYFRGEFVSLLGLLDRGDIRPEQAVGSWAGAFGHTQFMPSTYERLAVDFDGDGRRDLVGSVPDALASTANFLARAGWRPTQAWGFEVRVPEGFNPDLAGRRNKRPMEGWTALGLRRVDGGALPAQGSAGLLRMAGRGGPAFLVQSNFDALYRYNAAESYALAIALLSDRLRGLPPPVTPWPTDDPGLSRAERRELQTLLVARGHALGEIDGLLGSASRAAIEAEQRRLGLPADGRAGQNLLRALRAP